MMMEPATLPAELEVALMQLERGGGAVHYFVFEVDAEADWHGSDLHSSDWHSSDLHSRATFAGFELLKPQLEPYQLTLEPKLMSSATVSVETFLGVLRAGKEDFDSPSGYLSAKIAALSKNGSFSHPITDGYLYAFCEPPYSLQLAPNEAQRIFDTINAHLFGGFTDDLEIRRWSDNWSNFFEAGLEWWGAFWWTVHNHTKNQIVVLTASATD